MIDDGIMDLPVECGHGDLCILYRTVVAPHERIGDQLPSSGRLTRHFIYSLPECSTSILLHDNVKMRLQEQCSLMEMLRSRSDFMDTICTMHVQICHS